MKRNREGDVYWDAEPFSPVFGNMDIDVYMLYSFVLSIREQIFITAD